MNDLMKAVLRRRLPSSEKSVMNVYAMHADKNGEAFPSLVTVACETGLAKSTVIRALKSLVTSGDLVIVHEGGGRKSTTYRIASAPFIPQQSHGDTAAVAQPDSSSLTDECAIRNEDSYNNHVTPIEGDAPSVVDDCDSGLIDVAANQFMIERHLRGPHWYTKARDCFADIVSDLHLPPIRAKDHFDAKWQRFLEIGGTDAPKQLFHFMSDGLHLKPESQWGLHGANQSSRHQAKAEQRAASWDRAFGIRRELDS